MFGLAFGNSSLQKMLVNQCRSCFMGVPLEVTGGTTLKPLAYIIPIVDALESRYNSWGSCLCNNFEDIITSSNNYVAQKKLDDSNPGY